MPKPSKKTVSGSLIDFAFASEPNIDNPKIWIEQSKTSAFFSKREEDKANGELLEKLHLELEKIHNADKKKEKLSQIKSVTAKIKANKTFSMQLWAYAYFTHLKQNNPYITKNEGSIRIKEQLIKYLPESKPKGKSAQAGEIPNVKTIETRWLREMVKQD